MLSDYIFKECTNTCYALKTLRTWQTLAIAFPNSLITINGLHERSLLPICLLSSRTIKKKLQTAVVYTLPWLTLNWVTAYPNNLNLTYIHAWLSYSKYVTCREADAWDLTKLTFYTTLYDIFLLNISKIYLKQVRK